uniref:Putative secreted protein n=1 Tax=Anopheles triannulatus TaxID=58253 RepID=A0A2M4B190_9DIPT
MYWLYCFVPHLVSPLFVSLCVCWWLSGCDDCILLPVFFDLKAPVPLEMLVLIVIGEEGRDGVGTAGHHSGRCLLERRRVALDFLLWWVGANHLHHFVHWHSHSVGLLHILEPVHNLTLDDEIDANLVLDTLLNYKHVLFQLRQVAGEVELHRITVGRNESQLFHDHFAWVRIVENNLLRLCLSQ